MAVSVLLALTIHISLAQSTLSLSSATAAPDGTAMLNLTLQAAAGMEPAAVQWAFAYPPDKIPTFTVSAGPSLVSSGKAMYCRSVPGFYKCLAAGLNNTRIPNGVVAKVSLTVAAASGAVSIDNTDALGASPDGTAVGVTAAGGTVSAASPVTVLLSGQVAASGAGLSGVVITVNGDQSASAVTDSFGAYSISVPIGRKYTLSASRIGYIFTPPVTLANVTSNQVVNFAAASVAGLRFYPTTPCRIADTRVSSFQTGFGPPSLAAGSARIFAMASSAACPIPPNAAAYALNVTAVTKGYLGALRIWPAGDAMPDVSTLNSYASYSTAISNAVIVKAGIAGAINIHTTDAVDVVIDVNGYFAPPASGGFEFYPVVPCRLVDTRVAAFQFGFGPPSLPARASRTFAIPTAVACGIPSDAAAYSLNVTAIPSSTLGFLSLWPADKTMPTVSTLNVYTPGTVVANAAIVQAAANGAINTYVTDASDLVIDINGYFAPPGTNSLKFYPMTPCRMADTRVSSFPAGLGPPSIGAAQRSFPVTASTCGVPAGAGAYSFNVTAVPRAPSLGLLTAWPTGQSQPNVSILNSYNGSVVSNAAIVPAGVNGAITTYASDTTDVLFDISGYFAH